MPNVTLPERPDTSKTFERMSQYVGQPVAMQLVGMKNVKTKYGVTKAAVVDFIVADVGYFPDQLCFWSVVKTQVIEAKGTWVCGILDVDDTHEGSPYLIDATMMTDEQKMDLFAVIDEYDANPLLDDHRTDERPF